MIPKFNTILKLSGFSVEEAKSFFKEAFKTDKELWHKEKIWEIFKFHYNNNDFYRKFAGKEFSEWNDIPVIHPQDLKGDHLSKIPANLNRKNLYISSTSGSTGNPLIFIRDPLSHALVWEQVRVYYEQAGVSLDARQARMFGMSKKFPNILKVRLKDMLSNRYRFNIFDLSDVALSEWEKSFRKGKFEYLYGYTNSLVVFAKYFISKNYTLKSIAPSLISCIVTSEVCTDKDADTLSKGFGIPIFNEYGSSELGIMGFKEKNWWTTSESLLYYEVLDENNKVLPDGETGLLTCTSLFNKATPFIRYQLGDLASIRKTDGQTKIIELSGRLNDLAVLPSGKKIPGFSFYFVELNNMELFRGIKEFLFRQSPDGFTFEYVADKPLNDEDFNKIRKSVTLHFKEELKLTAVKLDKLERGKNGKFKHFISSM